MKTGRNKSRAKGHAEVRLGLSRSGANRLAEVTKGQSCYGANGHPEVMQGLNSSGQNGHPEDMQGLHCTGAIRHPKIMQGQTAPLQRRTCRGNAACGHLVLRAICYKCTCGALDVMQGLNSSGASTDGEVMQDQRRSGANGHAEVMPGQSNCGEIQDLTSADLVTRSAMQKTEYVPMKISQNEERHP